MREISERLGLVVLRSKKPDHENRGVFYRPDTVVLGTFSDHEIMLLAFFHEAGHFLDKTPHHTDGRGRPVGTSLSYIDAEARAWKIAFQLAEEEKIVFSAKAIRWAFEQLQTYVESAELDLVDIEKTKRARSFRMSLEGFLIEELTQRIPNQALSRFVANTYSSLFDSDDAPWRKRLWWIAKDLVRTADAIRQPGSAP